MIGNKKLNDEAIIIKEKRLKNEEMSKRIRRNQTHLV